MGGDSPAVSALRVASMHERLRHALEASVTGDVDLIDEVFTEDVVVRSPALSVSSRQQLKDDLEDRDDGLSNVRIAVTDIDVVGEKAIAEWRIEAEHSGPVLVGDDVLIEATGRAVVLSGATFAEFAGSRIACIRHYFDDASVMEQLLL